MHPPELRPRTGVRWIDRLVHRSAPDMQVPRLTNRVANTPPETVAPTWLESKERAEPRGSRQWLHAPLSFWSGSPRIPRRGQQALRKALRISRYTARS